MRKRRKVLSEKEFTFVITEFDDECATVVMKTLGVEIDDIALATTYMIWIVSERTTLSFDETVEFLAKRARTFTGAWLVVLPPKGGDGNECEEDKTER